MANASRQGFMLIAPRSRSVSQGYVHVPQPNLQTNQGFFQFGQCIVNTSDISEKIVETLYGTSLHGFQTTHI